jgi:hypothetical protein
MAATANRVLGRDMFPQVKGEGLNVGCMLTWGPCFQFRHRFFEPRPNKISEPFTVIKYDVEVSGFGSQVVNGHVAAAQEVPADDYPHDITFSLRIDRSSWLAIRHFPQLHTNPVAVIVAGQPIRASRRSAQWCVGCIEQLWRVRSKTISPAERDEAHKTFQEAIKVYRASLPKRRKEVERTRSI